MKRTASARYDGLGKDGKGHISTQSGVLAATPYGFHTRFEELPEGVSHGTNPEELIAAAHAGCFTMALAFALEANGHHHGALETNAEVTLEKDGDGFSIVSSALSLTHSVPGIEEDEFRKIAQEAKANCPVSKLLNAEITLDFH